MTITLDKKELQKIVSQFEKIAIGKTLPILDNLLFHVQGNEVTIIANSLEIGAKTTMLITTMNTDEFSFVVDAKVLSNCLAKINADGVVFELKNSRTLIIMAEGKKTKYEMNILNAEDFPKLPDEEMAVTAEISKNDFLAGINAVFYCIAENELNANVQGLNIVNRNGKLSLKAIDGYRLAQYETTSSCKEEVSALVTKETAKFLKSLLIKASCENIELSIMDNHIIVKIGEIEVIARKLSNPDFEFEKFKRKTFKTEVVVNREDFLNTLDMNLPIVLVASKTPVLMSISADNNEIIVSNTSEKGKSMAKCNAHSVTGDNLKIGFNISFLMDSIKNIETESVTIKFNTDVDAAEVFSDDEKIWALVLPMRLKSHN